MGNSDGVAGGARREWMKNWFFPVLRLGLLMRCPRLAVSMFFNRCKMIDSAGFVLVFLFRGVCNYTVIVGIFIL